MSVDNKLMAVYFGDQREHQFKIIDHIADDPSQHTFVDKYNFYFVRSDITTIEDCRAHYNLAEFP